MRSYGTAIVQVFRSPRSFFQHLYEASSASGSRIYASFLLLLTMASAAAVYSLGHGFVSGQIVQGAQKALTIACLAGGLYLLTGTMLVVRIARRSRKLSMVGLFLYGLYGGVSVLYVAKHLLS